MLFCPNCEFKIYPIEEEDKLYNQCLNCGYKDEFKSTIINKKIYKGKSAQMTVNEFCRHDVSLPRTDKKKCENSQCESHKKEGKDGNTTAVFIMDPTSLKLTYICTECGTNWTY